MCKVVFFLLTLILVCNHVSQAQATRHVIQLRHKSATTHSLSAPENFLTQKAILRRLRYNIPIDSFDIPVPSVYLDSIRNAGAVSILNTSRWLNNVCIVTSDAAALNAISNFSFVQSVDAVAARTTNEPVNGKFNQEEQTFDIATAEIPQNDLANIYNYG